MDLQTATTTLRNKVGADSGLGATLKFDCGEEGVVVIDGAARPSTVDNANRDTDCTIALTLATLGEMMSGELNPTTAFMSGRITVSGDMGVALKLQSVF
jgi:putative sterol carrier protein